jgi:mannose-1-phosphate guanylyltransferase / mannose-6-phosphate isomerase
MKSQTAELQIHTERGSMLGAPSVPSFLLQRADERPSEIAFRCGGSGRFQELSWGRYRDAVEVFAHGLMALGVKPGDRVAIMSEPFCEYFIADMAALCVGATIYCSHPGCTPQDARRRLESIGAKIFITGTRECADSVLAGEGPLTDLERLIVCDMPLGLSHPDDRIASFEEVQDSGRVHLRSNPGMLQTLVRAVRPDDLGLLVSTPGLDGADTGITHRELIGVLERALHGTRGLNGSEHAEMLPAPVTLLAERPMAPRLTLITESPLREDVAVVPARAEIKDEKKLDSGAAAGGRRRSPRLARGENGEAREQASATIFPVILSGGSGTRLWPLSRAMYPKQFTRFAGDQTSSMLAATLTRLPDADGFAQPIIVCNNDHRFLVQEELQNAGATPRAIMLEPVARNTAPAIAAAALLITRDDPDAIMAIMPSDHVVEDRDAFIAAVRQAAQVAGNSKLVLFGIAPDVPHTGYGYIRSGSALPDFRDVYSVDAFVEKPDVRTAEAYLAAGNYYWNSGIFVLNARTFLSELARAEPAVLEAAREAVAKATTDLGFFRLDPQAFAKAPNISVDYAVMERTKSAAVLPANFGWSDVGSWSSLWDLAPHDDDGNAVQGNAFLKSTENCYVDAGKALVATIGVKDLVIVNTADALLVADRSKAQDVSKLVADLRRSNRKEHAQHVRSYRPWGFFESLNIGPRFQVKLLHVKPGGKLSMQMHHHRSEHWVVVHGTAKVFVGDEEKLVRENESVYIVATQWHRLENPGKTPLELIEVQIGSYLGEDDIVRGDDIYHRAPDDTR